jgi:glycosyltransferase involved in cell wall biosynthesis
MQICLRESNIEHLIYDGGSDDRTCEIAHSYSHVKVISNGSKNGVYDAFNKSIDFAKGYYILFLNSDDFLNSNIDFHYILKILSERKDIWISGHLNWVDNSDKIIMSDDVNRNMSFNRFLISNTIRHPATFIQKDYLKNNLFDTSFKYAADYKFFLDLWGNGIEPKIIPYHISNFRIWENSLSSSFFESLNNEYLVRINWRLSKKYMVVHLFLDLFVFVVRRILLKIRNYRRYKLLVN